MSSIADTLMERRTAVLTQAQELAKTAVTEGRDLTADEAAKFDGMVAEADNLAKRAKEIAEGETRSRELEESFRKATGKDPEHRGSEGSESAFTKWAREARIGDVHDLAPVKGAERRAMDRVLAGTEARAMSATQGVAQDGVYGQLWEYAVSTSQILQSGVEIINTADGNQIPLPVVTAHATAATAAASAPLTASDAGLGLVNVGAIKDQYITLVPSELLSDVTFDLEGYLARAAGRELGKKITARAEAAAIAGYTASGATVAASAIGTSAFADALIDLFHAVAPEYRTDAAWMMADKYAGIVRKTKDGSGAYVWERSLAPGNPLTIDNKPFYIGTSLPTATTATTKPIYFGEWASLVVRIAGGLRFERSAEYAFGNDQVAFRAIVRSDAVVRDANAVKFLQLT